MLLVYSLASLVLQSVIVHFQFKFKIYYFSAKICTYRVGLSSFLNVMCCDDDSFITMGSHLQQTFPNAVKYHEKLKFDREPQNIDNILF